MLLSSSNCAPLLLESWPVVPFWPKCGDAGAGVRHIHDETVSPRTGGCLHTRIWRELQKYGSQGWEADCAQETQDCGNLDCSQLCSGVAKSRRPRHECITFDSRSIMAVTGGRRLRPEGSPDCVAPWFLAACPHDAIMAWTTPAGLWRRVTAYGWADVCCCMPRAEAPGPQGVPKGAHGSFMA